ncbi:MAG: hypothetical protein M0P71_01020 [Melioribacteraceae bacterium]|nr:hypothetical protein [Melioribacteraceae bacterium]
MRNKLINITYDYTNSTNLSFAEVEEAIKAGVENIHTTCLNFFDFAVLELGYDVIVVKKNLDSIILEDLLDSSTNVYTEKEIRRAHNVSKMLIAGAFKFKEL